MAYAAVGYSGYGVLVWIPWGNNGQHMSISVEDLENRHGESDTTVHDLHESGGYVGMFLEKRGHRMHNVVRYDWDFVRLGDHPS